MAVASRPSALRTYLEMIKIEHSIFALPFAMLGMVWGSLAAFGTPWPGWRTFFLIVLAMVSCRSAAMAYNRIVDREIDAKNPRTKVRAIPSGLLRLSDAMFFFYASVGIFLAAAAMLNPVCLALSPIALLFTLGYSWTKRFTPLCHWVLGISLGIAPAAAWIASTGKLQWEIVIVTGAVALWTAGFDILYSLQDEDFDREQGLRSLPQTVGVGRALTASRVCHAGAIVLLAWAGFALGTGPIYCAGVVAAAALLTYEQSLVRPGDLSKINLAFFTLNGFVSIGVFAFALADLLVRR